MNPIYHSPGHTLCLNSKLILRVISERLFLQPMNAAYTETTFRLVWRMAVHRVYPDTADSCDHAHQRPRTLFPPTVQRARTVHALFALPLAEALHTHARDWWSVATRLCVLWVLLFFFFSLPPPPFPPPRFTHTAERKGSQSEKRRPQPYRNRQQLWQPPSLCSKLASETKTRYQNILFLSAIAKIQRNGLTRGKAILLNCHFSFTQHFCLFSLQFF